MRLRVVLMVLGMLACPLIVAAQPPRIYVGGTLDVVTQTESDTNPMGGTNWGGRALVGASVSPHRAVELEIAFNGSDSWQYSYSLSGFRTADVVVSRRNTCFSGQLRIRGYGVVEPVVGLSYINGQTRRLATIGSSLYFDDKRLRIGLAAVGGVDAAVPLTSHVSFVPSLRVFGTLAMEGRDAQRGSIDAQTSIGALAIRYGASIRTTF
jgi:hypothetical protein